MFLILDLGQLFIEKIQKRRAALFFFYAFGSRHHQMRVLALRIALCQFRKLLAKLIPVETNQLLLAIGKAFCKHVLTDFFARLQHLNFAVDQAL